MSARLSRVIKRAALCSARGWLIGGLSLASLSLSFTGCQGLQEGDANQSPLAVAEWTLGQSLTREAVAPEALEPYLAKKALPQLQELQSAAEPDEALGVLTLNLEEGGRWAGRYAYLKEGWPLAIAFELEKTRAHWSVRELPFATVYKSLATMVGSQGVPLIKTGEPWAGGLISLDRSGRPLGEVVLTWAPPYAFIDGLPLYGKATQDKLIEGIALAFARREQMAAQAQASYFRRVTIAMRGSAQLSELMQVFSWVEDAGAVSISLLGRDDRGEARLVRLAQRSSTLSKGAPKRLLKGTLKGGGLLTLAAIQRDQAQAKSAEVAVGVGESSDEDLARSKVLGLYEQVPAGTLEGAIMRPEGEATLQELARALDAFQRVDPLLPVTIAPYQPQGAAKRASEGGAR